MDNRVTTALNSMNCVLHKDLIHLMLKMELDGLACIEQLHMVGVKILISCFGWGLQRRYVQKGMAGAQFTWLLHWITLAR